MSYRSYNPYTCKELCAYNTISNKELQGVLQQVEDAGPNWAGLSFEKRAEYLNRMADAMEHNSREFGLLITREMGKPLVQAVAEIRKSASVCRYYATHGAEMLQPEQREGDARRTELLFQPLGAILAVMPWNFPFWQVFRFLAPALMAGNTALLKHASNVPQCALAIERIARDAGVPRAVFRNLFVSHSQLAEIIAAPAVRGVTLTGSNAAGSRIAVQAGKHLKKTVLELGGSDPFVVFADADIIKAARYAVTARFQNGGQSCIAAKRLLVEEQAAPEFLDAMKKLLDEKTAGDPEQEGTFFGPLVHEQAVADLERQVVVSLKAGAKTEYKKEEVPRRPAFFPPMILVDVPPVAPVWQEEVFGPVVPLMTFRSEEEALRQANDTVYGLGATVWTSGASRISRWVRDVEAGTVAVNGMVKSHQAVPFGGVKDSGYGRELSDYGIREFVNVKTVNYY